MPVSPRRAHPPSPTPNDPRFGSEIRAEQTTDRPINYADIEDLLGDQREHVEIKATPEIRMAAMVDWD